LSDATPAVGRGRPSVVIICIGNPSRGDDAVGSLLHAWLQAWLADTQLPADIELLEDFQLQLEHALDLHGRTLALVIDAAERCSAPVLLQRVEPSSAVAHTSHALSPAAVLQVYRQVEASEPPPTYTLAVRGERFGLGEPVSADVAQRLEAAKALLLQLLQTPEPAYWAACATLPASPGPSPSISRNAG
jgi:hydrogenase maturation protease